MSLYGGFCRENLLLLSPEAEESPSLALLRFLGLSKEERSMFSVLGSAVERDRLDPLRP
jgi:hypothetical protein